MAEYEPTPEAVEAFKAAWHEADAEGDEGNRVSRGLAAALAQRDAELRAEVSVCYHQNAQYLAMMSERDALRAEVERLREGIEALATEGEAWGRGVAVELSKRLRTLLAGSGEQPGEVDGYCTCHDDQKGRTRDCGVKVHREAGRPAPVVPDGADVLREAEAALIRATKGDDPTAWAGTGWWHVHRLLAVVGQSVTDCNCGFGGQHDPANPRCRANRAAVRPSGQEGS